jgi:hypothetical protein
MALPPEVRFDHRLGALQACLKELKELRREVQKSVQNTKDPQEIDLGDETLQVIDNCLQAIEIDVSDLQYERKAEVKKARAAELVRQANEAEQKERAERIRKRRERTERKLAREAQALKRQEKAEDATRQQAAIPKKDVPVVIEKPEPSRRPTDENDPTAAPKPSVPTWLTKIPRQERKSGFLGILRRRGSQE